MSRHFQLRCLLFSIWLVTFHVAWVQGAFRRSQRSSHGIVESCNSDLRLGAVSHQTQADGTTQLQKEQLKSLKKDECLTFTTVKGRSECLQFLLEMYYGSEITLPCPQLPLILAYYNCTGCPWDKTPSTLRKNYTLPLPRTSFMKQNQVADWLITLLYMAHGILYLTMFATRGVLLSLLVLVLSAFGISSGSGGGIMPPVKVLDWNIPEYVYLGVLWWLFNTYNILAARAEDYYLFCESQASYYEYENVAGIVYATVLFISVSRCFRLSSGPKVADDDPEESSWLSFVLGVMRDRAQRAFPKVILATCVTFLPFTLCALYLWQSVFTVNVPLVTWLLRVYALLVEKISVWATFKFQRFYSKWYP